MNKPESAWSGFLEGEENEARTKASQKSNLPSMVYNECILCSSLPDGFVIRFTLLFTISVKGDWGYRI